MNYLLKLSVPLFFAQTFCTVAMTGIIWFVQVVHYPLFSQVGDSSFVSYERLHSKLTTWVVAPLMLVELASAIYFVFLPVASMERTETFIGLLLVVLIWISTFGLQVPQHNVLGKGFQQHAHSRLVATNWIRTSAWTARSILVFIWFYRALVHAI